jgi:hypothetical protein
MAGQSIPARLGSQAAGYWAIALTVGAILGAISYSLESKSGLAPLTTAALLVLLALPTLWLCLRALGETRGWLALGSAALELPQALQLGVPLRARLVLGRAAAIEGLSVQVRCQTISIQHNGGKTERSVSTRWSAVLPFTPESGALELNFDLPADQPPSEPAATSGTYHRWQLKVCQPGFGGYDFSLELPVAPAPAELLAKVRAGRLAHVHELAQAALGGRTDTAAAEGLLPAAIVVDNGAQGLVLDFQPARYGTVAPTLLLIGTMFLLAVALFVYLGGHAAKGGPPLIFHIVFGLFGVGLTGFGLYLGGQRIHSVIDRDGVRTRSAWFFLERRRQVARANIREVTIDSSLRSGETAFYSLRVRDYDGRPTTIGNGIPGEYGALFLREVVAGKLGLAAAPQPPV